MNDGDNGDSSGNGNGYDRALLRKYKNQVKLLTEEIAHHENEQSVKDWKNDELKVKLKLAIEELNNVKQDLAFETQRSQTLEEANSELQLRLKESKSQQAAILQELQQLKNEKRVISERIRQSYVELGTRRKISTSLIPDNNSEDENDNDECQEHQAHQTHQAHHDMSESDPLSGIGKRRASSRKFSSRTSDEQESSFEEWSEDEMDEMDEIHELEQDARALDTQNEPATQTLLQQYETLIDDLQLENERLVAQLRIQPPRTAKTTVSPLRKFLHETYPVMAKRPSFLLLWQPWYSYTPCPAKLKPVSMGIQVDIDI